MNDFNVQELAKEIAKYMPPPVSLNIALWGAKEVASFLAATPRQVTERYCVLPDFPKAIRLPGASTGRAHPRWEASEVVAWAQKYKTKKF